MRIAVVMTDPTEQQRPPRTLFKYRADAEFTERIFSTGLVWLSTATQLNDPFECSFRSAPSEWVSRTVNEMKQAQFQGLFMQVHAAVHDGTPYFGLPRAQVVAVFEDLKGREFDDAYERLRRFAENATGHRLSDPGRLLEDLEDRRNSLGLFSLSSVPDNVLMWAHYGDEHRGLCIGFTVTEGTPLADPKRCFPIRYATELPGFGDGGLITELQVFADGQTDVVVALSDPTFRSAISTKSPDWMYEQEWRYVEPRGGSYEWPAPISEVTFGLRFDNSRRAIYLELIEEFVAGDVDVYDIEKVPNTNLLRRKLAQVVKGRGRVESLHDQGHVQRLGTARVVGKHIESLIRAGDYQAALRDINFNLEKEPDAAHLLAQKALALGYSGSHREALAIYESLCLRFPFNADGWYQRAVALTELERYSEAIDCYRQALAINPLDASTNFNLACVLADSGNVGEALTHLKTAIQEGHPKAADLLAILERGR